MSDCAWTELDHPQRLEKSWKFKNFKRPWSLVQKISEYAEEVNHHPEICFGWGYLKLSIYSHDSNGLTDRDWNFVKMVDKILDDEND